MRKRVAVDHQKRPARSAGSGSGSPIAGAGLRRGPFVCYLRRFDRRRRRTALVAMKPGSRAGPTSSSGFASGGFAQLDPCRGMIAGAFPAADLAIDTGGGQPLGRLRAQEEVIDAQPGVPRPAVPHVIPERVHRRVGMQRADGVEPAVVEQTRKTRTRLAPKQRILGVGFCRIDIAVRRNDVVVPGQHDRNVRGNELPGVCRETIQPRELVIEFWSRLRIAVRRIERGDEDAVDGGFDKAGLRVVGIAGQSGPGDDRLAAPRQNRDPVPRFLAAPDRAIPRLLDRRPRELTVRGLELLQAHDVGRGGAQPGEQIGKPLVDVVDVERRDLHPGDYARFDSLVACPLWSSATGRKFLDLG